MAIVASIVAGALLGGLASVLLIGRRNLLFHMLVGALGAAMVAIPLAGFMVNPGFLSPQVSAGAVARSMIGAVLLLGFFLIVEIRARDR